MAKNEPYVEKPSYYMADVWENIKNSVLTNHSEEELKLMEIAFVLGWNSHEDFWRKTQFDDGK